MKIGKTIKDLRRENNMTQEMLAERLNISVSAVSQWEMEKTMPDISMIPILMDVFDVTADTLLGINDKDVDEYVESVIKQADESYKRFEHIEQYKLIKQLYEKYPNRLDVMSFYAFTLYETAYGENEDRLDKCIEICKHILDRSLDDKQRFHAIYYLCHCYDKKGDKESAIYYVNKLPQRPHFCGDWLKEKLCLFSEEERMEWYQQNAESFLWLLEQSMFDIADPNYTNPNCKFTVPQRVAILEQMIAITKLIYGDKLCDENGKLYAWHRIIGALCLFGNEQEKALDYFEKAYEYAEQFATSYQEGDSYTSLIFQGRKARPQSDWSNGAICFFDDLNSRFNGQERYRALDNNPRFIALKEKLANRLK